MLTASAALATETAGQQRFARDVAQLGQRTCFGSSPKKAQCEAAFPQGQCDRYSPNQVLSLPRLGGEIRTLARLVKSYQVVAPLAG